MSTKIVDDRREPDPWCSKLDDIVLADQWLTCIFDGSRYLIYIDKNGDAAGWRLGTYNPTPETVLPGDSLDEIELVNVEFRIKKDVQ